MTRMLGQEQHKQHRKNLFQNRNNNKINNRKSHPSNQKKKKDAKTITKSLLRTKSLLSQELDRVNQISTNLESDENVLNETKETGDSLSEVIFGAKGALRSLQNQEQREHVVLMASVVFFYLCVLYVVFSRIRIPFLLW